MVRRKESSVREALISVLERLVTRARAVCASGVTQRGSVALVAFAGQRAARLRPKKG